jgi:hypothetical protein
MLLSAAAVVVIGLSLVRILVFWSNHAYLGNVSGVWTALAVDLSNGVFYRPAFGPDGYGGARYFPLHVVLHTTLIKMLGDPLRSGQIVAAFSVSLLTVAAYALMRTLGASRLLAASSAAAVLASQATQTALLSIRGDALPASLNIFGVTMVAGQIVGSWQAIAAAGLFTLAFASKPTALYGVLAATLWLACTRRFRLAATVMFGTMAGGLIVIGLMHVLSGGRAFEPLGAGESTRASVMDFLRAPMSFARIVRQVPETLVFVQLGLAAVLALAVRARSVISLPVLLFGSALVMSVAIFAFEGTDTNHLIDLHVVSIVAVIAFVLSQRNTEAEFGVSALAVAALAASLSLVSGLVNREAEQRQGTLQQALALIPDERRPILAENPLVPIAAGQRPYMLNPYMFRLISQANPAYGDPLRRALQEQAFSAVVLERNPHDARGEEWYRTAYFGGDFIEQLEQRYEVKGTIGMRVVYGPRR